MCSCLITLVCTQYYDPTTRDYTELCTEFAEIAQDKYCQVSGSALPSFINVAISGQ